MEKKATFGAGCFWGVEAAFRQIDGVTKTEVGYEGGTLENPSYEDVCSHTTGHAEVVEVTYDPDQVSYEQLLDVFWAKHDPTQMNRQGWDIGDQYRSVVFFHDDEQRATAEKSKADLDASGEYRKPVVTRDRAGADVLPRRGVPPAVPREAGAVELHALAGRDGLAPKAFACDADHKRPCRLLPVRPPRPRRCRSGPRRRAGCPRRPAGRACSAGPPRAGCRTCPEWTRSAGAPGTQ